MGENVHRGKGFGERGEDFVAKKMWPRVTSFLRLIRSTGIEIFRFAQDDQCLSFWGEAEES